MSKPKVGDIYRWSWNDIELKARKDKAVSGTLYWCCSNICVFREDGKFWDTYWGDMNFDHSKRFTIEAANEKISLQYIGNFDDLVEADKNYRTYYDDSDCVDISHANMGRGGFYIKKGAKKSLNKMRKVMKRTLKKYESDAKYATERAERMRTEIKTLTIDSYVPATKDVSLFDESYEDES